MTLIECPRCGHTVMSVASTCPHCSYSLSEQRVKEAHRSSGTRCKQCNNVVPASATECPHCQAAAPARSIWRWALPSALLVAVTVVGLVLWLLRSQPSSVREAQQEAQVDQSHELGAPGQVDTVIAETPPPVAEPITALVPNQPGEQPETFVKWTSTWVNLRDARSPSAEILRVLDPGERVEVADLQRGWWAVYLGGERIGYVARSLMRDEPPESG